MTEQIRIDTPEHVDLAFEPAGLGSRFLAAFIDALIQGFGVFLWYLLLGAFGLVARTTTAPPAFGLTEGIVLAGFILFSFLFLSLYKVLLEAFWNGQTVGKRLVGIRVVKQNGMPAGFFPILVRNLLRILDMLPSGYALGMLCVLVTNKRQRIGDMAAGTIVVLERKAVVPSVPDLTGPPTTDLTVLREHVARLSEADLAPVRGFLQRRGDFKPEARQRVAQQLAQKVAVRMNWPQQMADEERFLEEVLHVRARM